MLLTFFYWKSLVCVPDVALNVQSAGGHECQSAFAVLRWNLHKRSNSLGLALTFLAASAIAQPNPVSRNVVPASNFGVVGDERTFNDAAMTSGSALVTTAEGNCTSADTHHPITIYGAGTRGIGHALVTTVVSCSGTNFVVATAASNNVNRQQAYTGTDNTSAFNAIHSYLLTHDGAVLIFQRGSGAYEYTNNRWLQGVVNVRILFNGAALRNVTTGAWGIRNATLAVNCDFFTSNCIPDDGAAAVTPINSVSAGSSSVIARTAGAATNVAVGNYVLIAGYNQQDGGYPPNLRYFEFHRITSVNASTGVIGLAEPLKYSYDANWYPQTNLGSENTVGPPFILSLDRTGKYAFTLAENVTLEDLVLLSSPFNDGTRTYGDLYTGGVLNFLCEHCTIGNLTPSQNASVVIRNSTIYSAEPDKLVDSLIFDHDTIYWLGEGTGVNTINIRNSDLESGENLAPRQLILDHNKIWNPGGGVGTGYTSGFPVLSAKLTNNVIFQGNSDNTPAFYIGNSSAYALRAITASSSTELTVRFSWTTLGSLSLGSQISTSSGKTGTVTSIEWDGSHLDIFGIFSSAPAANDVFYYHNVQQVEFSGNSWGNQSTQPLIGDTSTYDEIGP
jgi:hypothetical protein